MYIENISTKRGGRVYTCVLLRESFREGGKVKHRTVANLTNMSDEEIAAFRFALRHKGQLPDKIPLLDQYVRNIGVIFFLIIVIITSSQLVATAHKVEVKGVARPSRPGPGRD